MHYERVHSHAAVNSSGEQITFVWESGCTGAGHNMTQCLAPCASNVFLPIMAPEYCEHDLGMYTSFFELPWLLWQRD